jgi:hypothetical protein
MFLCFKNGATMKKFIPYSEQLKDPRWQKKRLEIMQRDNFQCQICGNKTKTLNVHHFQYGKNKKPWEYENDNLITLCEECHESITVLHNTYDYLIKNSVNSGRYNAFKEIINSIYYIDIVNLESIKNILYAIRSIESDSITSSCGLCQLNKQK